jgi:predicted nucleic acid-binding protein
MLDLVICNTSPLFYLHGLQNLTLLEKLYTRIVVPEAVVKELEAGRRQRSSSETQKAFFLKAGSVVLFRVFRFRGISKPLAVP